MMNIENFNWQRHQKAWDYIKNVVGLLCKSNKVLDDFSLRLTKATGMRLIDTIDHIFLEDTVGNKEDLIDAGFVKEGEHFACPFSRMPPVVLANDNRSECSRGVRVKVDHAPSFLMVHKFHRKIDGSPMSDYRSCSIHSENDVAFDIIERQHSNFYQPDLINNERIVSRLACLEQWHSRKRIGDNMEELYEELMNLGQKQIDLVGKNSAASLFFKVERQYWLSKNRAAQCLKNRLDSFGIGWANHDHHTYRSSRKNFLKLICFFQLLGFEPREKFYAGEEAQWGAQLLEHPAIGVVLFCDVDLEPQELDIDFNSDALPQRSKYGTIELWTSLHGDSLFQAGMHHLAVSSDFDQTHCVLEDGGIKCMKRFSDFQYLKQAFTKGEIWKVSGGRVARLQSRGVISPEEAKRFETKGAIGSHLEIIQREDGFKGFNQQRVSKIINETDPKKN